MHFSESGKSSVKLCVGIASIVLEGRFTGHEDDSLFESQDQNSQPFICDRNFRNDEKCIRPQRKVIVKTLDTFSTDIFKANSSQQSSAFDSFAGGLLNIRSFPSTSTSTPKKHHFSYIDVGWDEYENGTSSSRSIFLKSPSTILGFSGGYSSSESRLGRITKSSSSSNINPTPHTSAKSKQGIQPGPHCESFLRKMAIIKDGFTGEEHVCCPMNNVCHQWQLNLQSFLQILSRNETPCIEVYIGPESNALLLETWTFKMNSCSSTSTTMNIQSLCSAIRSQLYFSQMSSWVDLLRKLDTDNVVDINLKSRLKRNYRTKHAYLDVFYKIKSHEGIDLFSDKPIAHNFPETRISDTFTVNVTLKSLPRLEKIPTLNESNPHSKVTCDYVDAACLPPNFSNYSNNCNLLCFDAVPKGRRHSSKESPLSSSFISADDLPTSKRSGVRENQFADHHFFEQAINDVTLPPLYGNLPASNIEDDGEVFKIDSNISTISSNPQKDNLLSITEHKRSEPEMTAFTCSACDVHLPRDNGKIDSIISCDAYESCDKLIMEKLDFSSDMEQFPTKFDCRQCKRRKIRHASNTSKGKSNRRTMSECLVGNYQVDEQDEQCDLTLGSTLEFPICDKNVTCKVEESLGFNELNSYRRAFSDDLINQLTENLPPNPFRGKESFAINKENNNNCWDKKETFKAPLIPPENCRTKTLGFKKFFKKTHQETKRLHLLGSFEENLLKNRFQPKTIVNGYKALLGASGNFCPSQLTIPAQTKFYEFHGASSRITTPYLCEFRLSKNYSIPRSGQLNVTLMNPQGIVVRMFFISYDLRDMPSMSQTFIRQRMMATDDRMTQSDLNNLSTLQQMKYLRYTIHLRFQTSKSGRLSLHSDVKIIVMRKTEQDTAQAHAMNSIESFNDLRTITVMPENPKYSPRITIE